MRHFLTIGITGKGKIAILHGVEKEKHEHINEFRKKVADRKKSKFAEVRVIDLSRGVIKRKFFSTKDGSGKRTVARVVKVKARKSRKAKEPKANPAKRTVARVVKPKKAKAVKKTTVKRVVETKTSKASAARTKKSARTGKKSAGKKSAKRQPKGQPAGETIQAPPSAKSEGPTF